MARTRQEDPDFPRIAAPDNYHKPRDYIEIDSAYIRWHNYLWPAASWVIVFIAVLPALVSVKDMFTSETGYSPANHFFMSFVLCFVFAALSAAKKFILEKDKNNVRPRFVRST